MPTHTLFYALLSLTCLSTLVLAQGNWTTSPFNPFSLPLAVKSPYVNAWAPLGFNTTGSAPLSQAIPRLWNDVNADMGWDAAILVDGNPYQLLGVPPANTALVNAIQQSFVFTPTRSSYVLQAGLVNVTMTFMSPIEAKDIVRQSLPFSYLYFEVDSIDGNAHDIIIYSDVTGEWISGDNGLESEWQINESSDFVYLQMGLTSSDPYQEIDDRPQDATVYYCTKKTSGVSWQIGPADDIRADFANGTSLNDQAQVGTHPVGNPFNTLSFSVDLGSVSSTSDPIAFALGVVRDPVIQYTNRLTQIEERSAYYWSQFTNIHDAIGDVVNHSVDALSTAVSLDNQILGDADKISNNYGDILSLSTRQAMSALEYTLPKANGALNTSDVKAFMKDMGGIGSGGVNAVDVLYSAMPIYLYLNPDILGYLLSPLLEYQESPQYTNSYAAQDVGSRFPNATGNPNGHNQKIEHSANMLIMSLAHAQATGDGSLLAQHYGLLNSWADYLVNNTMNPVAETTSSSDGIASTNQTNLILKGIIGIGAMAKISQYGGRSDDQSNYNAIAKQYVQQWTNLASASDQLVLSFGSGSSGLIYNLYADKLLQLNLIDSSVYSLQTSFYKQQTSSWKYGIPLDSSNTSSITRSDWMLFAASSASDTTVRDAMISQVWEYAAVNSDQNLPFPISYHPDSGSWIAGQNSPAQGAIDQLFSVPLQTVDFSENSGGSGDGGDSTGSSNIGIIVGAVVGGLLGLGIIAALLFFFNRRRVRQQKGIYHVGDTVNPMQQMNIRSGDVIEPPTSSVDTETQRLRAVPYRCPSQASGADNSYPSSSSGSADIVAIRAQHMAETKLGREMRETGVNRSISVTSDGQSEMIRSHTLSRIGLKQNEILFEMDNIRREIERIREERAIFGEPLPSYDDELAALAARASR
ncbi:DUF1793-domain-containing protein [Sanghuangporus baumii]|uniref:DUF1793-domain-containing protein n=1 Tax=Sanghuangporus baumii TaxID=108892 RepID=A0A9Q5I3F8_SANBA|nr:DUF1793-domain-containing protein [Sanghuangporus baumii]